jgi:diguanylate cyclase (GGDEF)-like protein
MLRVLSCLTDQHDYRLVVLAVVVCLLSTYTAFRLFQRAQAFQGSGRAGWLFLTGVAAGSGIWATHFIAMLAFQPSIATGYLPGPTISSLFVAIGVTTAGFFLATLHKSMAWRALAGGLVGIGISTMHFTGMSGFEVAGHISWHLPTALTAVAFGAAFGAAAVVAADAPIGDWQRLLAPVLLALGIATMHFTAMGAVIIMPDPTVGVSASLLDSGHLAMAVAGVALLVIGTGIATALIDKRSEEGILRERREAQHRIRFLAEHDVLTGLFNRASFQMALDRACRPTPGGAVGGFALCSIDLDEFKQANDIYGHLAGDAVLQQVAERINGIAEEGFCARLSGDEFVVMMPGVLNRDSAGELAGSIVTRLAEAYEFQGEEIRIGCSVGVVLYPDDAGSADELLGRADMALYQAKSGRNRYAFFEPGLEKAISDRRTLAFELREAIEKDRLAVYYQPLATTETRTVRGFEALLRWQHPTRGPVPPMEFIPIAEENGTIIRLGLWVLRRACADATKWKEPLSIAVNLSAVQLQPELPIAVGQILMETGLTPSRLELEVTETALMKNPQRALAVLRQLKALGIRIALDDFGTGYSSLSMLQAFPFDKIKLDKTFVGRMADHHQAASIVRAVLGLSKSIGIPVVAEGVETEGQFAFLASEACDQVQGYLIGRPLPISYYSELVGENNFANAQVSTARAGLAQTAA